MPRSKPFKSLPLNALRAFEAASRLTSFKDAAAEIGVTPAAISHQIKALEELLGVRLFDRLHRSLRITPAGKRLGDVVQAAFGSIDDALHALAGDGAFAGPRTLTVSAVPTLAVKWLAPRIHLFEARQPRLELRILASDVVADLTSRREVDVALRYGPGGYAADLESHRLWPPGELVAVCAPSLFAEISIQTSADLARVPLLRTIIPGGQNPGWSAWLQAAGLSAPEADRLAAIGPLFGSTHLALEAAASGRGAALAPTILAEDDLRTGRLRRLWDVAIPDPFCYWVLLRRDRADEARIRSFVEWIVNAAAT